ncbi:MAG: ATP-binding cassette domain-containing protein [Dongiaceae bacterium]
MALGGTAAGGGNLGRRALVLLLVIGVPGLLIGPYAAGLLVQAYLFAILALATDVMWGYTGILTFASAAMFGVGAYAVGAVFVHLSLGPAAIPAAFAVAILLAAALSLVIGWLAFYSRIRVSEFYIALVTLGLSVLFSQTVSYGGALTGGSNGLSGFATVSLSAGWWYALGGGALLAAMVLALAVVGSDVGLILRAVRDHEVRCRYLGIHTPRLKTLVFTGGNAVAAAAGALYALYTTVVAPSLVGIVLATNVLIWVTLGGRGTIIGPVVAAVLVNAATPELSTTIPLYWQGALGLAFILVVLLLPRGLLPALGQAALRLAPRRRVPGPARAAASGRALYAAAAPGASPGEGPLVLEARGVGKSYGSFHALSGVDLEVRRGELVSIVGPNGAGKTSLVRCISDGAERSGGTVAVGGRPIGRSPPDAVVALGIGRKFQGASVFDSLTVGECLRIASWKGRMPSLWRRQPTVALPPASIAVIERLGLAPLWDSVARDISHGQRQALELAMVLALEPTLLVLDEPTAGLSQAERAAVGALLTQLVAGGNLAVLLIEHDFEFVKQISTRIVVLHEGRVLADGSVAEVAHSALVRDVYLGRTEREPAA